MASAPATNDDLEAAHQRFRDQVRGDIEHTIHTLTWRMVGLGIAIGGAGIAILRLT